MAHITNVKAYYVNKDADGNKTITEIKGCQCKSEPKYSFCWYPGKIDTATLIKEETNEKEEVVPQHKSVWILTPTELYNEAEEDVVDEVNNEEYEEHEESEEECSESESESEPKDTIDDVEAYVVYLNKDGDRCLREIKDCKHQQKYTKTFGNMDSDYCEEGTAKHAGGFDCVAMLNLDGKKIKVVPKYKSIWLLTPLNIYKEENGITDNNK